MINQWSKSFSLSLRKIEISEYFCGFYNLLSTPSRKQSNRLRSKNTIIAF